MTELYNNVKTSMLLARVVALSISDFFTRPMLSLAMMVTLVSILFWSIIYLLFHNMLSEFSHNLIAYVPFATASWIESIASMVLLISLFYQLVLVSVIISLILVLKKLVVSVNNNHYQIAFNEDANISGSVFAAIKSSVMFLVLYFLLLPTLFIPGINVAIHLFLWAILLRGTLFPYLGKGFLNEQVYSSLVRQHRWGIMVLCILLSLLYLVPVIGAFTAVFQLMVVIHYLLSRTAEFGSEPLSN